MKRIGIFFLFFIILVPTVDAVPIIEIFVDEKTPSNQNIPQVVVSSIENGDLELLVWYLDTNSSLHITAATERAQDLDAKNGDIFIQGVFWNKSNENLPNDFDNLDIELNIKQGNDNAIILNLHPMTINYFDEIAIDNLVFNGSLSVKNAFESLAGNMTLNKSTGINFTSYDFILPFFKNDSIQGDFNFSDSEHRFSGKLKNTNFTYFSDNMLINSSKSNIGSLCGKRSFICSFDKLFDITFNLILCFSLFD